jgi:uncharacterized protein
MSDADELSFDPESFSGLARLFPLPNLVLFPSVMQPLRVFEPRYCALLEEALAGDRLIALAILEPGWEKQYEGRPPIAPVACLGRVATSQRQPDGTYHVLLLGLRRISLLRELPPNKKFREAQVELLDDVYPAAGAAARPALQRRLVSAFRKVGPQIPAAGDQLDALLDTTMPLGMLTDIVAYTLDLDLRLKVQLLGELDVDRRANVLLEHFGKAAHPEDAQRQGFPPDFSKN